MEMQKQAGENTSGNVRKVPVMPERATGNLVQLHLGGFAVSCIAVGGLALGWFDYTTATSMIVMFGLMLALGYGWQAVRYHRAAPHEPLTNRFKVVSVLIAVAIIAALLRVMYNAGPLAVSCAMIAVLYVFFAYLSMLMALRKPGVLWMVAVNTLCGILGWGLAASFMIQLRLRYISILVAPDNGNELALLKICSRIAGFFSPVLLLVLAAIFIVAAFFLRIELYHLISGYTRRKLLVSIHTVIALVMAVAAGIFLFVAGNILEGRNELLKAEANRHFEVDLQGQGSAPLDFNAEFRGKFQAFAEKWSEAEIKYQQSSEKRFPYRWSSNNIAYLRWRIPADDGTFLKLLRESNGALEPLYPELDELIASRPAPQPGVLPNFTLRTFLELTAAWRMRTALVEGDFVKADKAWKQLGGILRDRCVLASPPVGSAISLNKWLDSTEAMINSGKCSEQWLMQLEDEAALWNKVLDMPQKPAMRTYLVQFYNNLEALNNNSDLAYPPAYSDIRCFCPIPWIMVAAEKNLLLKRFGGSCESWEEIGFSGKGNGSFYTNYMLDVICDGTTPLAEARNRINSMLILAAAKRWQMKNGKLPENIQQLKPDFLKEIPVDYTGDNREFKLIAGKLPVQIFECGSGYILQEQRDSFAVVLDEDMNTAAAMLINKQ